MSCTEDEAAYRLLAKAGYPVYEKEFVLSGVLKQVYTVGCLREPLTSLILTTALPLCSAFLHPGVARARARPCRCTRAGRSCNCNHDHYHDHNICKQGTQSTKEIDGSLFGCSIVVAVLMYLFEPRCSPERWLQPATRTKMEARTTLRQSDTRPTTSTTNNNNNMCNNNNAATNLEKERTRASA